MTKEINERAARGGEQPGFRILRNTVLRPDGQRLEQRLAQRILGARQILRIHGKIRHQPSIGLARHPLDRAADLFFSTASHPVILRLVWGSRTRTSTAPYEAAGQRAAHSMAASSEGNSRMEN